MVKKNPDTAKKDFDISLYQNEKRINKVFIGEHNTEKMKLYGANVNLARTIPDIRDGLKPVERRVLYSMYQFSKAIDKFKKVQTLIGDTMNIHPHGDASIYDVLVKLAQPWKNLINPIDGHGNFGSIDGSSAAAARYIEAKLSKYSLDCFFSDYNPSIMEMKPTYQPDIEEPEYFITKYPNMLMSISVGMGFGIATGIPTYNLEEILQSTISLIKDPSTKLSLVPDMPTGCLIIDEGKFEEISETGRGVFKMRGEILINEEKHMLLVTSIPFQSSLLRVKEKIKELVENKTITGFKDMQDYSANRIHLELYFKNDVDLRHVIKTLYSKTDLQNSFSVQLKMINNYEVRDYSIHSALLEWIGVRRNFKKKFYINKLVKAEERKHFLEILLFILNKDNAEKTMKIIKKSSTSEIVDKLVKEYGISSLQAKVIANMKMKEFSKTAYQSYQEEFNSIPKEIKKCKEIITDNKKINKIIIEELEDGIKKYHAPRRSKVIKIVDKEEYENTNHWLVFTKNGYVKKMSEDTNNIGNIAVGDDASFMIKVNNREDIIIFDKRGSTHSLEVGKIQPVDLESIGVPLSRYISITGEPIMVFQKNKLKEDSSFVFITKNGIIKKTSISNFAFKSSTIGILLMKDDELVSVLNIKDDADIVVYTHYGTGLRFNTGEISPTQRLSRGVVGLIMTENDFVSGISVIKKSDKYIFILTTTGKVKKCKLSIFPQKERRDETVSLITLNGKERLIHASSCSNEDSYTIFLKGSKHELSAKEVPVKLKIDKADKFIPVCKGDKILKVVKHSKK